MDACQNLAGARRLLFQHEPPPMGFFNSFDPNEEGIGMKKSVVAFAFANSTLNNPHLAVING
jgi:hypothetical protein